MTLSRRELLVRGAAAGAALRFAAADWLAAAPQAAGKYAEAFRAIDAMVERYMREMNSPGMTFVLADRDSILRVATYGLSDIERKEPVRPEHLFQIGSITKSFVAIALLQLRDEGKLDLHAPIARYLPWVKIEPRDVITTHHLLTHTSGLPSGPPLFLPDPGAHHLSGFPPGSHFSYCNMGYRLLGYLLETLDGRTYPESVQARVFKPLGMNATMAYIAPELRERTANNYTPFRDDVPYSRQGRVASAPPFIYEGAAGSISSTPEDMGRYVRMIASRGKGLMSPASFADFTKRHISTGENDESYGYGLFLTKIDGHEVARHTGGMVSFMSAMHVDLEDGIGAFASVNAQQGYRPNPVTIYALRAIRAVNANKPLPELPLPNPQTKIAGAKDLAGVYTSPEGEKIEFVADGDALWLVSGAKRLAVETSPSGLIVRDRDFDRFPFSFERATKDGGPSVSVGHGARWWMSDRYTGARTFAVPESWSAFTGHYRNDSPWSGSVRIVARQGKLWADGTVPLRQVDPVTFRLADSDFNPEWVQFLDVVNGKSRHLKVSGDDFYRVDVP